MPDGFEIEFTKPVDPKSAADLASYSVESFIYKYHPVYGSPPVNNEVCKIRGVKVSDDGKKVRLVVDNLRRYYVHNITLEGIRDKDNSYSLVHPTAYYTLNNIPEGQKLSMSEVSTKNSAVSVEKKTAVASGGLATTKKAANTSGTNKTVVATKPSKAPAPTYNEVKGLLAKHTCQACHNPTKKQIGPAYADVAKRNYSNEQIYKLIQNPQPQNWPGYATEMPPMPHVPKADALKIAAYINSLK
jgi:cytochrome c551/c552